MRNDAGFTLIEVIIVIAIIAVVATVAVPNLIGSRGAAQLIGAADSLVGDFNLAKWSAVRENG